MTSYERKFPLLILLGLVGLLVVVASPVRPETPPDAATVFDRYIEATGGRAAWEAIENRVVKASLEVPGEGVRVRMTTYSAQPNLSYSILESETAGRTEKGSDGTNVWEMNPVFGPILKEGSVRADFLREIRLDKYLDWQLHYEEAEFLGSEELDGKAVWKIALWPPEANKQLLYFDQQSGLLLRLDLVAESLSGNMALEVNLGDYRRAGGVLVPFRTVMRALGHERIVTTESIESNVELAPDFFVPPEEVLDLVTSE